MYNVNCMTLTLIDGTDDIVYTPLASVQWALVASHITHTMQTVSLSCYINSVFPFCVFSSSELRIRFRVSYPHTFPVPYGMSSTLL